MKDVKEIFEGFVGSCNGLNKSLSETNKLIQRLKQNRTFPKQHPFKKYIL